MSHAERVPEPGEGKKERVSVMQGETGSPQHRIEESAGLAIRIFCTCGRQGENTITTRVEEGKLRDTAEVGLVELLYFVRKKENHHLG